MRRVLVLSLAAALAPTASSHAAGFGGYETPPPVALSVLEPDGALRDVWRARTQPIAAPCWAPDGTIGAATRLPGPAVLRRHLTAATGAPRPLPKLTRWVSLSPTCSGVAVGRNRLRPGLVIDNALDIGPIGRRATHRAIWRSDTHWDGAAWSQDGRSVAVNVNGTLRIIDPTTGGQRAALRDVPAANVALSPDGSALAFWRDAGLRTLQTGGRAFRTIIDRTAEQFSEAAWSPDGRTIAVVGHHSAVRLIDVASGAATTVLPRSIIAHSLSWTPDGSSLLAWIAKRGISREILVRITPTTGGPAVRIPGVTADYGYPVAWSPDGRAAFWRDAPR